MYQPGRPPNHASCSMTQERREPKPSFKSCMEGWTVSLRDGGDEEERCICMHGGRGWDGMGWDKMGFDGMGWDGMGWTHR